MSTHPVGRGGYDHRQFESFSELITAHRGNINPEFDSFLAKHDDVRKSLTQHRAKHNARTFPADERGPSYAHLVTQAAPQLPQDLAAVADVPGLSEPSIDAVGLVKKIKSGELNAEQAVRTAIARTKLAQAVLGCCSEIVEDEAIARAKELDRRRAAGEVLGPLHGLPISVKGHIATKGHTSCRGFLIDCLSPDAVDALPRTDVAPDHLIKMVGTYVPQEDAPLVRALQQAGAVIVAKTTMPQTIMHLDTRSVLYGQALNPHNLALSPGGSSGGESALLSSGAVSCSWGTDIGGSIRQPCAVTGLWGLRPSCNRLPMSLFRNSSPGNIGIGAACGPMCKSLRDVQLCMQTLLSPNALGEGRALWDIDHTLRPEPWRDVPGWATPEERRGRTLRVGVMLDDGVVAPVAPVQRALSKVLRQLDSLAASQDRWLEIKVLKQPLGDHRAAWNLIRKCYYLDGGRLARAYMGATGEEILPLTQHILANEHVKNHDATGVFAAMVEREAYKAEYWAAWDAAGIDVLLCPATPGVANRPETIKYWGYTSAFNLLDYPGIVFPAGIVADAEVDAAWEREHPPAGPHGPEDVEFSTEYRTHRAVFDGAPVGLQLIAKRDEELLRAAEVIERALAQ